MQTQCKYMKSLKIISSQPSDKDKKIIPHELYSVRSINQNFSVRMVGIS